MRAILPTAMIMLLVGCVSPPRVELAGNAEIDDRSDSAASAILPIQINNPNDRSIELIEYVYSISIPGQPSWQGRHAGGLVLSPGFDRVAHLPIVLPASIPDGSEGWISGSLHYLDTSTLAESLAEWGLRPTTSFSGRFAITTPMGPIHEISP